MKRRKAGQLTWADRHDEPKPDDAGVRREAKRRINRLERREAKEHTREDAD